MPKQWWFRFGKKKPKKSAIDPTLPFMEQIRQLQQQIDKRRHKKQIGQEQKKNPSEIVLSKEKSRRILLRWICESNPRAKRQLGILVILGLGRTAKEVAEILEITEDEVLDAFLIINRSITCLDS